MISGPRNVSTAIMYAFDNRNDFIGVDEPYYAHYLSKRDVDHPGKGEILLSQNHDPNVVTSEIHALAKQRNVFVKNMAHHILKEQDHSFLSGMINFLLIRNPKQLIVSFSKVIENPTINDIGLKRSFEIMQWLKANGMQPIVLDSAEILKNAEITFQKLCVKLDIPFDQNMLKWQKGPKSIDGIWAKYWYENVHKTTQFESKTTRDEPLPEHLTDLYTEANEYYIALSEYLIEVDKM